MLWLEDNEKITAKKQKTIISTQYIRTIMTKQHHMSP